MNIQELIRPNIRKLKPYASARSQANVQENLLLDANENPFSDAGRYPDPQQKQVKQALSAFYSIHENSIMPGNGSDELIDLILRAFVVPGRDNIITLNPSYGMYKVAAQVQNAEIREISTTECFQIDVEEVMRATDAKSKVIFLCSPNNPTGNLLNEKDIETVLHFFPGIVVVDQAYVDFSDSKPWRERIREFPNLVVLQTFSKAWGLASIRAGLLFANPEIVEVLNKIKLPYNVNELTQQKILQALKTPKVVSNWIQEIKAERNFLSRELSQLTMVESVFPSDANYLLVRFKDANSVYTQLRKKNIVVRNRSNQHLCENTLRITIGKPEENRRLLSALTEIEKQPGSAQFTIFFYKD